MTNAQEKMNRIKKRLGLAVGIAVGVSVSVLLNHYVFASPSFDEVMVKAAEELNEDCPVMLDQETRLDSASVPSENNFMYHYTLVNWVKDSIDANAFRSVMEPIILESVKTNPEMQIYREHKTTMSYSYYDMNGNFLTEIEVTADQYLVKE